MSEASDRLRKWLRYQAGDPTGKPDYDGLCDDVTSVLAELDGMAITAAQLSAAWGRYTDFFGEPPHGTGQQMAALLSLVKPSVDTAPPG